MNSKRDTRKKENLVIGLKKKMESEFIILILTAKMAGEQGI